MIDTDREPFYALLANVYAFYRTDTSPFALGVWWQGMRPYEFEAVSRAISTHCTNPDVGQYLPKPADIVRMLQGGTQDQAMGAWSKLDAALRVVGPYRDVVFDDPLIHAVLSDMGTGWLGLAEKNEDEWPFLGKEFAMRYRGFAMRRECPAYPPVLIGIAGANNRHEGKSIEPPVLLGDIDKARAVMRGGSMQPRIQATSERPQLVAVKGGE